MSCGCRVYREILARAFTEIDANSQPYDVQRDLCQKIHGIKGQPCVYQSMYHKEK